MPPTQPYVLSDTLPVYARPNRHERRRAWAIVPRAIRDQAPVRRLVWLPARTRALLSRTITRRNALDRVLAVAKGLAPDSPKCARFAGAKYREALDRQVRANPAATRSTSRWPWANLRGTP